MPPSVPSAAALSERAFAPLHCLQATFRAAHSVSTDERGGGTWRTKKRPKKRLTGITRGLVGPAQRNLRLCNGQVGRDEGGLSRDSRPPSLNLLQQLGALPPLVPCPGLPCAVLTLGSDPFTLRLDLFGKHDTRSNRVCHLVGFIEWDTSQVQQ